MPRFVAVHTVPWTEEQLRQFRPLALPPGVAWKQTYCAFDDGKFFCEWEAPNEAAIEQAFKDNQVPFDGIYPVRLFDVAKGEFED